MYYPEEQVLEKLNSLIDSKIEVVESSSSNAVPILERLEAMLASGNQDVLPARQVLKGEFLGVAKKSISKYINLMDPTAIQFKVFRELSNFLDMAYTGDFKDIAKDYTSYLSLGHPLSTSPTIEEISEKELTETRAEWLSSDSRIEPTLRPVVASGFLAEPGSLEHRYIVARLLATDTEEVPREVVFSIADRK